MIISASRRTDIPALYSDWLRRRIRAGFCTVPNPFNPKQVARVSLAPADVHAIVFWTRHARPIFGLLPELNRLGFRYYFLYTITGYGRPLEARTPPLDVALRTFVGLAERVQPGAVVWRYDPIVVGPAFPAEEHLQRFSHIAQKLRGYTRRVVISLVSLYRKTQRRVGALYSWENGVSREPPDDPSVPGLLRGMVRIAADNGMNVQACAQHEDYSALGIAPAKCIDDRLLCELFGGRWVSRKDPGQRQTCRCVPSKDIGMPDTCTFGCAYCYATRSDVMSLKRRREHDPSSPSLHGHHKPTVGDAKPDNLRLL